MSWFGTQKIYATHVLALFSGGGAQVHEVDRNTAGPLAGWGDPEVDLLISEGQRQLDRHQEDLERIRGRAQVLLALGIALIATTGALRETVAKASSWIVTPLWILSLGVLGWSSLGAAATSIVRADMSTIHASVLSRRRAPVKRGLATDYARLMPKNENQIATRLINLRLAVSFTLVGAFLALLTWIWASASQPTTTQRASGTASSAPSAFVAERLPRPPGGGVRLRRREAVSARAVSLEVFGKAGRGFGLTRAGDGQVTPAATNNAGRTWDVAGPVLGARRLQNAIGVALAGTHNTSGAAFAFGTGVVDVTTTGGRTWWQTQLAGRLVSVGATGGVLIAVVELSSGPMSRHHGATIEVYTSTDGGRHWRLRRH